MSQTRRAPSSDKPPPKPLTARQIVDRVLPSVVLVIAEDENGEAISWGSGFFYRPGLVATNLHVLTRASKASVKVLKDGVTYGVAEVRGIDIRRDLCVLRVDDTSTPPLVMSTPSDPYELPDAAVGDEIYVAGNPKGLEGSFSRGIISGIRSELGLIQIDAPISPGSSGGPVVDNHAEVIGIAVSSVVGGQNLNFAIPIELFPSRIEIKKSCKAWCEA
jgi:S1-C subfamily serine protease